MTLELCRGLQRHELHLGGRLQPNFPLIENLAIAALEKINYNGEEKWCYVMDRFREIILQDRIIIIDNTASGQKQLLDYPALNRLILGQMWYGKKLLEKFALKILGIDEFGHTMSGWRTGVLLHLPEVTRENFGNFQMRRQDNLNQAILGSTYDIDQWIFLAWVSGYLSHTKLG